MTKKKFNDLASTKQKGLPANKGWRKFLPKEFAKRFLKTLGAASLCRLEHRPHRAHLRPPIRPR